MGLCLNILLLVFTAAAEPQTPYDPCAEFGANGPARENCEFSRAQLQNPGPSTTFNGATLLPPGETIVSDAFPAGGAAQTDLTPGSALVACGDRLDKCLQDCKSHPTEGTEFGLSCFQQCARKNADCKPVLEAERIINVNTGVAEFITNTLGEAQPNPSPHVTVNAPEGYAIEFNDSAR